MTSLHCLIREDCWDVCTCIAFPPYSRVFPPHLSAVPHIPYSSHSKIPFMEVLCSVSNKNAMHPLCQSTLCLIYLLCQFTLRVDSCGSYVWEILPKGSNSVITVKRDLRFDLPWNSSRNKHPVNGRNSVQF